MILEAVFAFFLLLTLSPPPPTPAPLGLYCMTSTVYGEARSEPDLGQALVAQTILNRVGAPGRPASICGVVAQRNQFAGYVAHRRVVDRHAWERAERTSRAVIAGSYFLGTCGTASHFDGVHFKPAPWTRSKRMRFLCRVNNQNFYKEFPYE